MADADVPRDVRIKFRRIALVSDRPHPHEWEPLLEPYTNHVLNVDITNWSCADLIDLPYSCMVVDGRIQDATGGGYVAAHAERFWPPRPVLTFYDEVRTSDWDIAMMTGFGSGVMVPFSPESVEPAIIDFMRDKVKYDPEDTDNWRAQIGSRQSKSPRQLDAIMRGDNGIDDIAKLTVEELASYVGGVGVEYSIAALITSVLGGSRTDLIESRLDWFRRTSVTDRGFVKWCLSTSYTPVGAKRWWTTKRRALSGQTPSDLWDQDRERVIKLAKLAYRNPIRGYGGAVGEEEDSR